MPTSPHLIDSQPQLDELCDNLTSVGDHPIACDTEFVRTQTYWPHLCVVQLALDGTQFAVDLLADLDFTQLQTQLLDQSAPRIFHAAKQDLEAFYSVYERLPTAVFDTQIAAGLLGTQPQIGYAGLVKELLDIDIPKDQTRTDWSRRPLTDAQLSYALDDVAHLHELFEIVCGKLKALDRYEWALEDCALLLEPSQYSIPADTAWQRLASIPYLPVPVQARARRLAEWREDRAKSANRPRQWILSDKALLAIAHLNPQSRDEMTSVDDLPPAVARKQGKNIVAVVVAANADIDKGDWELQQEPVPVPPDKQHVKHLGSIVRRSAEQLGIAPEILATRKDIAGILNGRDNVRALTGWRRSVIGDSLLEAK